MGTTSPLPNRCRNIIIIIIIIILRKLVYFILITVLLISFIIFRFYSKNSGIRYNLYLVCIRFAYFIVSIYC